jgi:putative hydrolase of the HAD superfamily
MRLKALLVDLDGVIRQWPSSDNLIETRYSLPAGAIRRTAFAPDLLPLAILGRITDQEWRQKIAESLELEFSLGSTATDAVLEWSQPIGQVDYVTLSLL